MEQFPTGSGRALYRWSPGAVLMAALCGRRWRRLCKERPHGGLCHENGESLYTTLSALSAPAMFLFPPPERGTFKLFSTEPPAGEARCASCARRAWCHQSCWEKPRLLRQWWKGFVGLLFSWWVSKVIYNVWCWFCRAPLSLRDRESGNRVVTEWDQLQSGNRAASEL